MHLHSAFNQRCYAINKTVSVDLNSWSHAPYKMAARPIVTAYGKNRGCMPKRNYLKLFALVGLTLGLFLSGCSKQESATEGNQLNAEGKVAQAEKQLEEAKKELTATEQRTQTADQQRTVTLPSGSPIAVRTITSLSTKTHNTGEPFEAVLDQVLEIDNVVVAKRGASVTGVVSSSDPGGRVKGVASIALNLKTIRAESGELLSVTTQSLKKYARTTKKKDAMKIGITSGIGAAIGAIAGGGKGAAIGAGAGAAGGTGLVVATHGDPAVVPSESLLSFRLAAPVTYK
jgi:hypothetical protein